MEFILQEWLNKINNVKSLEELEEIRLSVLGKSGALTKEFFALKNLSVEEKKQKANELNSYKTKFIELFEEKKGFLEKIFENENMKKDYIDVSLYSPQSKRAAIHPINSTMEKVVDYFLSMNFSIGKGPLIEENFYNFEALNLALHHPARDMQDTFYFNDSKLLRTHTSPVQIRTMLEEKPPIRMISPGKVFRRDFDLTHTPMFHQVEGLVVDKKDKVSFANLKFILEDFLVYMFGDIKVRFRSSFFPFTEPSSEIDISCVFCQSEGCSVCSKTGWLEVLGCGIVHPNVFSTVKYKDFSGYAFGLGIERFAMLIHKIPDLRSLFEGDLRLLEQFK